MRLMQSPPDYNWATFGPFFVVSLPASNSGGCPHQQAISLKQKDALIEGQGEALLRAETAIKAVRVELD